MRTPTSGHDGKMQDLTTNGYANGCGIDCYSTLNSEKIIGAGDELQLKPIIHTQTNGVENSREIDANDEDEYQKPVGELLFKDENFKDLLLCRLNTLRRNRELCDVVLLVDQREIYAHKAVLAAVSPMLFDLLTPQVAGQQRDDSPTSFANVTPPQAVQTTATNPKTDQHPTQPTNQQLQSQHQQHSIEQVSPTYLELKDVEFECFEAIINYAYSGSLEICKKKVADLYKTASRFRMQSCAKACAKYLAQQLNPQNCIGFRKCANRTNDTLLANKIDVYVQKNIAEISQTSKEFLSLPSIQVEVVSCSENRLDTYNLIQDERKLTEKVLDWLQQQIHDLPEHAVFRMEMITEKMHMLYLDDDLILQDCRDISENTTVGSVDIIVDYKKINRRSAAQSSCSKAKGLHNKGGIPVMTSPGPKIARFSSTESMNSLASESEEVEWKLIAVVRSSESYFTALAVIRRQLATLSIRVIDNPTSGNGEDDQHSSYVHPHVGEISKFPLAHMEMARCSVGAVCLDGQLVVCGGYDRGECLRSVETYNPSTNIWTGLPSMNKERGRFDAAVCENKIYAVGGSDGSRDLVNSECYDPMSGHWTYTSQMHHARSNNGVTAADGFVYTIGGCQGQRPMKDCERYNCSTNQWETIAPLQNARYQAACCSWNDKVIAVGGCDMWNCIASVELYDPIIDAWRFLPPLGTARRGCGVAVISDKLYVIGGSDGAQSLCAVEILDLANPQALWRPGPPLTCPRGNVRAVVMMKPTGFRLYAIGGFNGKSFLNSMEYLEEGGHEWKTTVGTEDTLVSTTNSNQLSASLSQPTFTITEDPVGESEN